MSILVCGRCGQKTAPGSSYCPRDQWMMIADTPERLGAVATLDFEVPRSGGFLDRRRFDHQHNSLDRAVRAFVDERIPFLESELGRLDTPETTPPPETQVQIALLHRELGEISFIDGNYQRAHAHLERAYERNRGDLETAVNFAVVLAQRGQLLPALEILRTVCSSYPNAPLPLLNLALIALKARRDDAVLEAVAHLEQLWQADANFNRQWRDLAMTARGLALLQLERPTEARAALEETARSTGEVDKNASFTQTAAGADALNNLALAEIGMGEIAAGTARLRAALRLEPGHARVHNNLGVLAYLQGRIDIAFKYFDLARHVEEQIEMPDPGRINNFAVLLAARGDIDGSFEQFVAAGAHERAEFEVFYNLGRAYIEHGKPDKGAENLRRAFAISPQNADVHVVLGAAYLLRKQSELKAEAIKHLRRALQLDPNHRIALGDLALGLFEMEQYEAAERLLAQAMKTHPGGIEAQYTLALMLMDEGDEVSWGKAGGRFLTLVEKNPELVACLYNTALCQFLMGFRDASAKQLQIVLQRDAAFGPAYYLMGVGHAVGKRLDEALLAWQKAVEYEPNNPELQANMGYVFYKREKWQSAIKCYYRAHQMMPEDAALLSSLGLCFARAKQFPQAVTAFTESLALDARAPATHSNIGLAYYLQQQVEMAMAHWRVVSQLDSSYAERRGDEIQKSFDDEMVALRPLKWRDRIVGLAPTLPRAHTRLLPGYEVDTFRLMLSDAKLEKLATQKRDLILTHRHIAGMNLHGK